MWIGTHFFIYLIIHGMHCEEFVSKKKLCCGAIFDYKEVTSIKNIQVEVQGHTDAYQIDFFWNIKKNSDKSRNDLQRHTRLNELLKKCNNASLSNNFMLPLYIFHCGCGTSGTESYLRVVYHFFFFCPQAFIFTCAFDNLVLSELLCIVPSYT